MAIYNINFLPTVKNNGGTALNAGNSVFDNPVSQNSFSGKLSSLIVLPFGSTVVANVGGGATYLNEDVPTIPWSSTRPLVKRHTNTLAGKPNYTLFTSGNPDTNLTSSIHPITQYRTRLQSTAYRDNKYDLYTGKYQAGYPDNDLSDFGQDNAASPTRNNPGVIVFKHYRLITKQNYPAKTG